MSRKVDLYLPVVLLHRYGCSLVIHTKNRTREIPLRFVVRQELEEHDLLSSSIIFKRFSNSTAVFCNSWQDCSNDALNDARETGLDLLEIRYLICSSWCISAFNRSISAELWVVDMLQCLIYNKRERLRVDFDLFHERQWSQNKQAIESSWPIETEIRFFALKFLGHLIIH